MSLAVVFSRASVGMDAPLVNVEVSLASGLPSFSIVGLPETVVKESKDRVRSAIVYSGFDFPVKRIVVNLAPADIPKEGGRFDVAIALAILVASNQLPADSLDDYEFGGELALSGKLRPFKGVLPFAIATRKTGRILVVSRENAHEAQLLKDLNIIVAHNLLTLCAHFHGKKQLTFLPQSPMNIRHHDTHSLLAVKGQWRAKRALTIAASGGHNMLLTGPPGSGKTMLANRLPGLLPLMTERQAEEVAAIFSLSNSGFDSTLWRVRPFRAPHHTASSVALVGGGRPVKPGEISLAHNGVLFLDELPEFKRHVLESLREPLEAGSITISRSMQCIEYPCQFQLIAAMNPCPCGYYGDYSGRCQCTSDQVRRYQGRISGPFFERIDLHVEVARVRYTEFSEIHSTRQISHASVRTQVVKTQCRQMERSQKLNALLSGSEIERICVLDRDNKKYMEKIIDKLDISARSYYRILRLAKTIADLEANDHIERQYLEEAVSYRQFHISENLDLN